MSTSCFIGRVLEDGKVEYIYSHWDGYIEGVGATLHRYHDTDEKVKALISFGDASSIYENTSPKEGESHSYESPAKGVSIYYCRDRNEDWEDVKPKIIDDETSFFGNRSMWTEYSYLFKDGKWYVKEHGEAVQDLASALGLA